MDGSIKKLFVKYREHETRLIRLEKAVLESCPGTDPRQGENPDTISGPRRRREPSNPGMYVQDGNGGRNSGTEGRQGMDRSIKT